MMEISSYFIVQEIKKSINKTTCFCSKGQNVLVIHFIAPFVLNQDERQMEKKSKHKCFSFSHDSFPFTMACRKVCNSLEFRKDCKRQPSREVELKNAIDIPNTYWLQMSQTQFLLSPYAIFGVKVACLSSWGICYHFHCLCFLNKEHYFSSFNCG